MPKDMRSILFCFVFNWGRSLMSEDLLRTRELCQAPRTMLSTYAILMHPYCPDRESNPGLPRDRRGLWHYTTCLALTALVFQETAL